MLKACNAEREKQKLRILEERQVEDSATCPYKGKGKACKCVRLQAARHRDVPVRLTHALVLSF